MRYRQARVNFFSTVGKHPNNMYSDDRLSEEKLLGENTTLDDSDTPNHPSNCYFNNHIYLWGFQLTFFLISLFVLLSLFSYRNTTQRCNCEDHVPMYSPALEAVRNTGHNQRFDGSFATPNRFKGTPNPNIDAAWANITYRNGMLPRSWVTFWLIVVGGVINISEETLHAVNASVEYSVKLAPEIGGGYMASVEALHQLHCLNMLRQATYEDYYRDKAEAWQDSPQILRYHLGRISYIGTSWQ